MLNIGRQPLYLGLLALLQLVGLALFCKGFFPYKIYLSGHATPDDMPTFLKDLHNEPEFDRLVFVVIDALRNDFILGNDSGFDFINSQIERGAASAFTAKATAPTVTMPRIKAMTTGTIPSFLDAILNIAESDTSSSLDFHDNWVYQFKNNNNKTIHFFGDDTWIRLFPNLFDKTDGTTSFLVSDTVQVDLNVTRHIKTDLVEMDWDAVIFHYLGLDHIGHLGGPKSPLMKPKQQEMDRAIESMYEIISKQDAERMIHDSQAKGTLMVVCGDHGMNEKGNHGGSSIEETSAALVFLSPRFESRPSIKTFPRMEEKDVMMGHPIIDQIDIVPTLATRFGFPIPKNNLGKVISNLYGMENVGQILYRLGSNAHQLAQLLTRLYPEVSQFIEDIHFKDENSPGQYYAKAILSHQNYLKTGKDGKETIEAYEKFIEIAQSYLSKTSTDYSLNLMSTGVVFIVSSAIGFTMWATQVSKSTHVDWNFCKRFGIFSVLAYSASMFSSSFVEEEQMTWYYITQTICFLSVIHLLGLPIMQTLGEKWYPVGLCMSQLVLVRIGFSWSTIQAWVLSYPTLQWHLMALSLIISVMGGLKTMQALKERHTIDVNQTASIIQNIVKAALVLIHVLNSILVLVYKIQATQGEGVSTTTTAAAQASEVYKELLNWELVRDLDQVQLGKLIFNYQGAGIFVLCGLFYVTKRASLLTIAETKPGKKTSVFLQLLLHLSTPIWILLSKAQNASIFVIFCLQLLILLQWQKYMLCKKSRIPVWLICLLVNGLSQTGFFLTGHTNSIGTIDLSNAYVGVQEYDTLLIGVLTFCSNWACSIWWCIAGWILIENEEDQEQQLQQQKAEETEEEEKKKKSGRWISYMVTQSSLFSLVLGFLSISVTILREHLFIWTVFSPKYLYQIAWTVLYHWVVQVCLGSIFTQVLFKWNNFTEEIDC